MNWNSNIGAMSRRIHRFSTSESIENDNPVPETLQNSKNLRVRRSKTQDLAATVDESSSLCEEYAANCNRVGIVVDPSIYISLQTNWEVMKPTSRFSEGGLQPLIGVLNDKTEVRKLNLEGTTMVDARFRHGGNGNSNARALTEILRHSTKINEVNLCRTGLDDDGVVEICRAIKSNSSVTTLNLASNSFGVTGARALEDALRVNRSLKTLNLTNNQLGFESIKMLECACLPSGPVLMKAGNFVFEEILNAVTHGVAFLLSIVAGVVLINAVEEQGHVTDYHYWGCMVYSFSLVYLFLASSVYHSFFMVASNTRDVLQVLDNIGIYMLIAGTYTPMLLIGLHNSTRGMYLLIFEWCFAGICSMFTTYADLNLPLNNNIKLFSFLGMGAGCLLIFNEIYSSLAFNCVIMYMLGAAAYVVGVIFFIMGESTPIYHTVWHLFVVLAATIHWFGTFHHIVGIDIRKGGTIDSIEQSMAQIFT